MRRFAFGALAVLEVDFRLLFLPLELLRDFAFVLAAVDFLAGDFLLFPLLEPFVLAASFLAAFTNDCTNSSFRMECQPLTPRRLAICASSFCL